MKASLRSSSKRLVVMALAFVALSLSAAVFAQESSASQSTAVVPQPLITQPVNEAQLTVLKRSTHPLARPEFDLGTAPATLPMERMLLVLKRSPEQESTLRRLLDDQQDKGSANYHKWLTPTQFGRQFGPTDSDMQIITSWLQSHGFRVSTTKGRTVLEFSGSASQVQEAFHTAIHKYVVNGEQHWANASDPQIPTALTPALAGVLTLHNFLQRSFVHFDKNPVAARFTPGKSPYVTFPAQNGQPATHALGPEDYATIYNINPVYNAPPFNQGSGITIGVVGRSNLFNDFGPGNDVIDFRSTFGLPFTNPQIILNGPDPGDLGAGEEAEATLDTTWSGAVAPQANIDFVVSASTNTADGIDLSEVYIIENNFADIMTESFGSCEYANTDSRIAATNSLAEQAAAQGITYFVSTGDEGAEGCDNPNFETVATGPVSVNMFASTPFTIAVGGTMFNENGQDSTYWSTAAPTAETALSFIPEDVWNESCDTTGCASIWAGSGGASAGNIQNTLIGGTTPGILKPSWQSGVTGIPGDGVRDLPDVSLTSASHDPYLLCLEGSCSQGFIFFVWGTSAAAPSFAGIMALVESQEANLNPGQSPRQGQANYVLYPLAALQIANSWQCNGSSATLPDISHCIFNDTTVGNNSVPGEAGYPNGLYSAGTGYDLATGLGSVNVANLLANWNSVNFSPTTTTLVLNNNSPVNITHGQSVPVSITVAPSSGTAVPTGEAVLRTANLLAPSTLELFDLANGQALSSTSQLPGNGIIGYNVWAHYSGDATFAPSDSNMVAVTVGAEPSTTSLSVLTFDANGNQFNFTGGPFGSFVYLRADVHGQSQLGRPTGTVTFSDSFGAIPGGGAFQLNAGEPSIAGSNTATPNGVISFDTGAHTISASYSGDLSFNPSSTSSSLTFTITSGFFASIASNQAAVSIPTPGSSGSTSMTLSNSSGFSGTINLACTGLPSEAQCLFSPASVAATGTANTTPVTITVTTMAAHTAQNAMQYPYYFAGLMGGSFALAGVFFFGLPKRRHRAMIFMLMLLALLMLVPACGGGGGSTSKTPPPVQDPGTPPGTYNVGVTATSGSLTSSTGFMLVLQ